MTTRFNLSPSTRIMVSAPDPCLAGKACSEVRAGSSAVVLGGSSMAEAGAGGTTVSAMIGEGVETGGGKVLDKTGRYGMGLTGRTRCAAARGSSLMYGFDENRMEK